MGHRLLGGQGPGRAAPPGRHRAAGAALSGPSASAPALTARTGFELELLAPPGSSRAALATELARRCGGLVRRSFHADSEPSLVPGMGRFLHLTPGFEVLDAEGEPVCSLVDDVTLVTDLDPRAAPRPGWHRVLSDDARLLRLIAARADPAAPLEQVLDPVAALFGTSVQVHGAVRRVDDAAGATVALAAPLPGERERPCEVVTPPVTADHAAVLDRLLAPARELGFTVPVEAAVHLHLDGGPYRSPQALANVVRLFTAWRPALWAVLGTNPACRRLGALPPALVDLVEREWTGPGAWEGLRRAAGAVGLTKFADVNLTALVAERPRRDTLEVRILPGSLDAVAVVERAALLEALLARCRRPEPLPGPTSEDARAAARELVALAGRG